MEEFFQKCCNGLPGTSVGEKVEVVGLLFAVIGGAFALWVFWVTANRFLKQSRSSHYSALDDMYTELLNTGIERSHLRDPVKIPHYVSFLKSQRTIFERQKAEAAEMESQNGLEKGTVPARYDDTGADDFKYRDEAMEYSIYAFMIYNFLETIHDRCDDTAKWPHYHPDKTLRNTWEGILKEENRLHAEWFALETQPFCDDTSKFCVGFVDFLSNDRLGLKSWKYRSAYRIYNRRGAADGKKVVWKGGYTPYSEKRLLRLYQRFVALFE